MSEHEKAEYTTFYGDPKTVAFCSKSVVCIEQDEFRMVRMSREAWAAMVQSWTGMLAREEAAE